MTEEEMRKKEEEEFQTGPLSVLTQAVKHNTQVELVNISSVHAASLSCCVPYTGSH